jgi:hypothetical protein
MWVHVFLPNSLENIDARLDPGRRECKPIRNLRPVGYTFQYLMTDGKTEAPQPDPAYP